MNYDDFNGLDLAYPDEIADMLLDEIADLCECGALDESLDDENRETVKADLVECLYQIKATAENPYNSDYWRTLYKVISDLTNNR